MTITIYHDGWTDFRVAIPYDLIYYTDDLRDAIDMGRDLWGVADPVFVLEPTGADQ